MCTHAVLILLRHKANHACGIHDTFGHAFIDVLLHAAVDVHPAGNAELGQRLAGGDDALLIVLLQQGLPQPPH